MNSINNYANNNTVTEMLDIISPSIFLFINKLSLFLTPSQHLENSLIEPSERSSFDTSNSEPTKPSLKVNYINFKEKTSPDVESPTNEESPVLQLLLQLISSLQHQRGYKEKEDSSHEEETLQQKLHNNKYLDSVIPPVLPSLVPSLVQSELPSRLENVLKNILQTLTSTQRSNETKFDIIIELLQKPRSTKSPSSSRNSSPNRITRTTPSSPRTNNKSLTPHSSKSNNQRKPQNSQNRSPNSKRKTSQFLKRNVTLSPPRQSKISNSTSSKVNCQLKHQPTPVTPPPSPNYKSDTTTSTPTNVNPPYSTTSSKAIDTPLSSIPSLILTDEPSKIPLKDKPKQKSSSHNNESQSPKTLKSKDDSSKSLAPLFLPSSKEKSSSSPNIISSNSYYQVLHKICSKPSGTNEVFNITRQKFKVFKALSHNIDNIFVDKYTPLLDNDDKNILHKLQNFCYVKEITEDNLHK